MLGQKTFKGEKILKYIFNKSETSNHLVVVFSGFSKPGVPARYNYMRTLDDIDCNKLFILDSYGERGVYYMGLNRDQSIDISVKMLIDDICEKNQISSENVITAGSSKGGYASIYFAFKYGYGHCIAGSPQSQIGNYLLEEVDCANVATDISGGATNQDKQYLNSLLFNVIQNTPYQPNINIHLGKGEEHYSKHVVPLIQWLDKKGIDYNLDLGDYSKHAEVATHYPPFLIDHVSKIVNS
ncbi:Two component regulator three Y domain-containing protein [Bacillus salacetis]|uniref:Two component regulator three Y domain-containing protein n=1 Tax=Bacillus salacetis TaxID=2315464 RepID=A0A3A1R0J2_9BACI|nr:Two component regulator three Y domain-containing protein [Bacillus salacetis]RIW31874.1 Two component regulator three Y domain-containing protein [Bacillus salacetis]